ncbi:MAG: DUF2017 domain-containing protein, partial [Actinobacteria bacterium]|nr:DUF2017 domain-containing protein [Actinomycetota bacterium]
MPVFERSDGGVRWSMEPWELPLLRELRDDLRTLLVTDDADDPAIRRFHPPTVRGDDAADAELRGLIRDELLAARLRGLDALLDVLDRARTSEERVRVELVDDEPFLVLGVLNDLRLAFGTAVGVGTFDPADLAEDDPVLPTLALMDHLAFLQEALLAVVDPVSLTHYDDHAPSSGDDDHAPSSGDDDHDGPDE